MTSSHDIFLFVLEGVEFVNTAETVFPDHGHCLQKPNCPFINNDPPLMCPFINNDPPSFLVQIFFQKKKVKTLGNFHRNASVSGGLVGEETQKHGGGDGEGVGGVLK